MKFYQCKECGRIIAVQDGEQTRGEEKRRQPYREKVCAEDAACDRSGLETQRRLPLEIHQDAFVNELRLQIVAALRHDFADHAALSERYHQPCRL